MKETKAMRELYAAEERRDRQVADRNGRAIVLALWLLGLLASASFFVFCKVTDKEAGARAAYDPSAYQGSFGNQYLFYSFVLLVCVAIGAFYQLPAWRGDVARAKKAEKEYQEALDKAMPLKKARPAGQKKKPKGGQN